MPGNNGESEASREQRARVFYWLMEYMGCENRRVKWVKGKTFEEAWHRCRDGNWLHWIMIHITEIHCYVIYKFDLNANGCVVPASAKVFREHYPIPHIRKDLWEMAEKQLKKERRSKLAEAK